MMADIPLILLSLIVPALLGMSLIRVGLGANVTKRIGAHMTPTWPTTIGYGYVLGLIGVTLIMRVLSLAKIRWDFALVSAIALALSAFFLLLTPAIKTKVFWARRLHTAWDQLSKPLKIAVLLGLTLIIFRHITIALELTTRPLYAWDAWAHWATKAKAWVANGGITAMLPLHEWRAVPAAFGADQAYTDQAWFYPHTISLIQSWSALALGRFDDSLINLPWLFFSISMLLASYGQARALGASPLVAFAFTFILGTLPFFNTHVALGGYADFPLAVIYGLAVTSLAVWAKSMSIGTRLTERLANADNRQLLVAIVLAAILPSIKLPGIIWIASLALCIFVIVWPRAGFTLFVVAAIVGIGIVFFASASGLTIFAYQFKPTGDPSAVIDGLIKNVFAFANWHLFWYALIGMIVWRWRSLFAREVIALTVIALFAGLFFGVVFFFTVTSAYISDYGTVNRALIHVVPALAVFGLVLFQNPTAENYD